MKRISSLILALLATITFANAEIIERVQIGDLYYNLDTENKTAEVTYKSYDNTYHYYNYNWKISKANIPSSVVYNDESYAVISVGDNAFYTCNSLQTVTLPNSIISIGKFSFGSCKNLKSVSINDGVVSIGNSAFCNNSNLTAISLPNSISIMGPSVFSDCPKLSSVNIPTSLDKISEKTFFSCSSLTSIVIPDNISEIGDMAFYVCENLVSVYIPSSITKIGSETFFSCKAMTSIEVDEGNSNYCSIDDILYDKDKKRLIQCPGKKQGNVIVPNSVLNIERNAFANCSDVASVTLPSELKKVEYGLFAGCTSLESVNIPNNVDSIGDYAFSGCSHLMSIVVPQNVVSIGVQAFANCTSLSYIKIDAATPPIITNKNVFDKITCSIYVPCGKLDIYKSASYWSQLASMLANAPLSLKINITSSELGSVTTPGSICEDTIITAVPNEGYRFVQWTDGNTDNPRQIELTQDTTFEAVFSPIQYTLNVEWNSEAGRVEGEIGTFDYLTSHTIQAIPNDGYMFVKWSDGITTNPRTISLTNDIYLEAIFVTNRLKVDFVDWDGTILKTDSVDFNGSATPPTDNPRREGYTFSGWDKSFSKVTDDLIVTALYLQKPPTDMTTDEMGAINGVFSVAEGRQVVFSKGNLQYNAAQGTHACADGTTQQGTWRFAEEQYDARLSENLNRSETYDGWIDLFSYGASGYNGMIPYRRTQIGYNDPMYQQIGALQGSYYDFGLYNAISNGGNQPSMWRMFTLPEWEYIIRERPNAYRLRGHANINGTNGLILLPDNCDTIALRKITTFNPSDYVMNNYSSDVWNRIEALGVVFLPAANYIRAYNAGEFYLDSDGTVGAYMCAHNKQQTLLEVAYFSSEHVGTAGIPGQYIVVRLVQDVEVFHLNAISNNSAWGTVSGDMLYWNEPITVTATPKDRYHFVQWSDGNTENPRTFTLTSDSTIIAEFAIDTYALSVSCDSEEGSITGKSGTFDYLSEHTFEAVANYGYTFNRWSDGVTTNPRTIVLTKDSTITALYDINYYPVVLLGHDGKLLSKQSVAYKHSAQQPEIPAREGYTFSGWSTDIESIVDSTYAIALYDKIGGTVTYLSEEGDVIASENVDLHLPEAPSIEGKSFKGWLTESANSENGIVLRATYTSDNPTTSEDVTVTPSSNSADVSFPFITGALTYELVIRDLSGNVVCKIMFSATGQLLGIAFAPSRNRNQQATQSTGFNFTVEGLNASTTYNYEFVAYDDTDDAIETLSGSFTTTADTPTNIDNAPAATAPQKYIQDGHLFIDNNNRTFDALGQQVR